MGSHDHLENIEPVVFRLGIQCTGHQYRSNDLPIYPLHLIKPTARVFDPAFHLVKPNDQNRIHHYGNIHRKNSSRHRPHGRIYGLRIGYCHNKSSCVLHYQLTTVKLHRYVLGNDHREKPFQDHPGQKQRQSSNCNRPELWVLDCTTVHGSQNWLYLVLLLFPPANGSGMADPWHQQMWIHFHRDLSELDSQQGLPWMGYGRLHQN